MNEIVQVTGYYREQTLTHLLAQLSMTSASHYVNSHVCRQDE